MTQKNRESPAFRRGRDVKNKDQKKDLIEGYEWVEHEWVCPVRGKVKELVKMTKLKAIKPAKEDEDVAFLLSKAGQVDDPD
jgi:hypothetical protein